MTVLERLLAVSGRSKPCPWQLPQPNRSKLVASCQCHFFSRVLTVSGTATVIEKYANSTDDRTNASGWNRNGATTSARALKCGAATPFKVALHMSELTLPSSPHSVRTLPSGGYRWHRRSDEPETVSHGPEVEAISSVCEYSESRTGSVHL